MHYWDMYLGIDPKRRDTQNPDPFVGANSYIGPEVGNMDWLLAQVPETFSVRDIDAQGNAKPESRSKPKARSIIRKMLKFLRL
tara:strand:+ start:1550 stop:1798 length:249 start_codon:yes stop_codon:yes gene_type:complete